MPLAIERRLLLVSLVSAGAILAARDADAAHPSLYFDAADVAKYRAGTTASDVRAAIFRAIDSGTRGAMKDGTTCDRFGYAPDRGPATMPFAVECMLTGDAAMCDWARRWLMCVVRYGSSSPWEDPPDFVEAGSLAGVAVGYDILSDPSLPNHLSSTEQAEVKARLTRETQFVVDKIKSGIWWHDEYLQNHNWIDTGAVGLSALALRGDVPDATTCGWLAVVADDFSKVDERLALVTDGTWHEGFSYEGSSLAGWLPFPIALRHAVTSGTLSCPPPGGKTAWPDYTATPLLQAFPRYRAVGSLPGNMHQSILLHGDFFGWSSPEALLALHYAGARHADPEAMWLAAEHATSKPRVTYAYELGSTALEYLITDTKVAAAPPTALDHYLDDLGGQISRSGYDAKAAVLGVKVGAFGGLGNWKRLAADAAKGGTESLDFGHDHEDDLTFAFYAKGEWLAPEVPGYVTHGYCTAGSPPMYQTKYHNGLTIDDVGQLGDDVVCRGTGSKKIPWTRAGTTTSHATTRSFSFISAEGSALYPASLGLDALTREVLFVDRECFVTRDHLHASTAHSYQWYTHALDAIVRDAGDGSWLRAESKHDQALGLRVITPATFTFSTWRDTPPHGPSAAEFIDPDLTLSGAKLATTPVTDGRFLVVACPTTISGWSGRPKIVPLGDVAAARGFTMSRDGVESMFAFADTVDASVTAGGLTVTGLVGGVETSTTGETFLVIGGSSLSRDGKPLVEVDAAKGALEARVTGSRLDLSGQGFTRARILAAKTSEVTMNLAPIPFDRDGEYVVVPAAGTSLETGPTGTDGGADGGGDANEAGTTPDARGDGGRATDGEPGELPSDAAGCTCATDVTPSEPTGSGILAASSLCLAVLALRRRDRRLPRK
jgi:hypothetical protein